MAYIIQGNNIHEKDGLTVDESSSIALYSMEWKPPEKSFHFILNETLRDKRRETLLPPWWKFLRLFFPGLSKLPSANHRIIYCGIKIDLRDQYKKDERIVWWGFSSCTKTLRILEKDKFLGKSGARTVFTIETNTGKNIGEHSFYPKEDEIVLLPGREFEVISSADMGNQLTIIHLKEVQTQFANLPRLPSSNPPLSTSTGTITTAKLTASSIQPKPIIQRVKVSYSMNYLTDNDIPRVIKEALQQKPCTMLDLSRNNITHEGAALLSKALKHNEVSDSLNTSNIDSENKKDSISEHINLKNVDSSFRAHRSFLVNENAPHCLIHQTSIQDVPCPKTNFVSFRLLDESLLFRIEKILLIRF